jgi:predicted MFS family arabinose efflux permease
MMETSDRNPLTPTTTFRKLVISWITMFIIGSDLFVVSPLLPLIASDYAVPPASAALSVTTFALAYMLCAPFLGRLADRIGRRQVLSYCLCVFSAANLLTAIAANLTWLVTARCFAGAAAAGVSPSVYALVGTSAQPDRRATCLAIAVSGLLISLSVGAPIGLLTAESFGWPVVFAALGALGLIVVWANNRVWRHPGDASKLEALPNRLNTAAIGARLAPTVLWSTAVYTVYIYLGGGLTSLGYSADELAEVILFYGCGAISGALIGGRVADRFGARRTSAIALAGLCLCLLLLRLAVGTGVLAVGAFALTSLVAQVFFPAQQISLANDFPASRTTILAWNNSALFLGISIGSLIGGQASSIAGFDGDLVAAATVAIFGWIAHQRDGWTRITGFFMQPPGRSGIQGAR